MAKKRGKEFQSLMEAMEFFRATGAQGGKKAAKNMTAAERKERARKAAQASAAVRSKKAKAKKAAAKRKGK